MTEIKADSDSSDQSKRTLLGVGLASLMRGTTVEPTESAPSVREPSIQVSGEILPADSTDPTDHSSTRDATDPDRATSDHASVDRRVPTEAMSAVYPLLHSSHRRRRIAALATIGALVLSVGVGLGVRWLVSRSPSVASANVAPVKAQPTEPIKPSPATGPVNPSPATGPVNPSTSTASRDVGAAVTPPAPARVVTPQEPVAQVREPIASAEPHSVQLGDGSCALVVNSQVTGEVFVDDQPVGPTPVTVSGLWCGRQIIVQITRGGFDAWRKTIRTQEGRVSRIKAALRRTAPAPMSVATPVPAPVQVPAPAPPPSAASPQAAVEWFPLGAAATIAPATR